MIYVLIAISSVFIGLAFILTEKNAKYLLAGYNTMTDEERKQVDIKGFIPYFRNFHVFLGVSFFVFSILLLSYVSLNTATIFICVYPIITEIYFVISVRKFNSKM